MYIRLTISALFLLGIYSISEYIFTPMNLYYEIHGLDKVMHTLGGFFVGLLFIALFLCTKKTFSLSRVLFATFLIAIGWEGYEYMLDYYAIRQWGGLSDSISDVFFGLLGAFTAYFLHKKEYV